jgi:hypothetical protein
LSSSSCSIGCRLLGVSLIFVIMEHGMRAQRYGGNDRVISRTIFVWLDYRPQCGEEIEPKNHLRTMIP